MLLHIKFWIWRPNHLLFVYERPTCRRRLGRCHVIDLFYQLSTDINGSIMAHMEDKHNLFATYFQVSIRVSRCLLLIVMHLVVVEWKILFWSSIIILVYNPAHSKCLVMVQLSNICRFWNGKVFFCAVGEQSLQSLSSSYVANAASVSEDYARLLIVIYSLFKVF